jgi:pyrroloquinoline quinone biosynthesis protein B
MSVEAILLGTAQDAGVPQAGCYCPNCQQARTDPTQHQWVVCLGLVDHTTHQSWLIDATPDFREQLHALRQFAPDCPLAGIILTHAHIGHYTGLIHLGLEVMNVQHLPLYVAARMAHFLSHNVPWSHLVNQSHVSLRELTSGLEMQLSPALRLLPLDVPHRAEWSDTLAAIVSGSKRRLFYCPDIDGWDGWTHDLRSVVEEVDVALLDGSFFSAAELPGRDLAQIPHPFVTDTAARLAGVAAEVRFIHLNHSNPLLTDGPERAWLARQGFGVGEFGLRWVLD